MLLLSFHVHVAKYIGATALELLDVIDWSQKTYSEEKAEIDGYLNRFKQRFSKLLIRTFFLKSFQ
jgi:hypothetical protein